MLVLRRESATPRFWSSKTRFKGDCVIPVSCALGPEPEPEPARFVDFGLSFFAVDDEDNLPPETTTSRSRTAVQYIRVHGEAQHGPTGQSVWVSMLGS